MFIRVCRSSVIASVGLVFYGVLVTICFPVVGVGGRVLMEWSLRGGFAIDIGFPVVLDSFRLVFSMVVTVISSIVVLFRTSYMDSEENLSRFIWLVILFVISMNFLIFVPRVAAAILG